MIRIDNVGECVDQVLAAVGTHIVLALPLGLGKPVPFVNELYRRALSNPDLKLTILTALSLRRPQPRNDLERRLVEPILQRLYGDYEELNFLRDRQSGALPPNVTVIEFFFEPGSALGNGNAQQNYLSANYTHVARDLQDRGVNVLAHLVASRDTGSAQRLSLACNPDVTLDLLPLLEPLRAEGRRVVLVAMIHPQMPYMAGSAELPAERFDFVLDDPAARRGLFSVPNPALQTVDYAIGLHASSLIRDGGTLQIGIGELGDSIVYALLLRQQNNQPYRDLLKALDGPSWRQRSDRIGGRDIFDKGLFGSSEMLVDQMLDLIRAGIMSRKVYDSVVLQRLLSSGKLSEPFGSEILPLLLEAGVPARLDRRWFEELRRYGVFRQRCEYRDGRVRYPGNDWIDANLADEAACQAIAASCLGRTLQNGKLLHAGFFLGPAGFYAALNDLPVDVLTQIDMRGVGYINQLYGDDYELRVLQRAAARFVNTTMMVTLLGAAISDGLDDGQVVSGVGGQFNFVAMGHALPDARSILCLRATRNKNGRVSSNVRFGYGSCTIPRHLRDVIVTEYGVADLRGRTDSETIAAILDISDSRFQDQLLDEAKRAGKISRDHRIPDNRRANLPERLERVLAAHRALGRFSEYPFGSDLNEQEILIARALRTMATAAARPLGKLKMLAAAALRQPRERERPYLQRMGFDQSMSLRERLTARALARQLGQML
ncbi:MAG: acetyl-CoA hydrolase/transferase C-terminal domain-containing protein [Steroidobacteraceae bacterium]